MAQKEMRVVYCDTLIALAEKNPAVMVVEADLMKATGTTAFKNKFPERGINVGVAEANMVGIAAGLGVTGKIPFAASFGCFASRRAFDQFFLSANYAKLNVKLVGTDPGISAAFNGGTHMPFEDMGMMRLVPDLTIIEPSDPVSLEKLTEKCAEHYGCTYMRLHRKAVPVVYNENETFELGKGKVLRDGSSAVIIALGAIMVQEALKARDLLKERNIDTAVIDILTVKPIDRELVLSYAKKTGAVVTAENHQCSGGLGGTIAELLCTEFPVPMAMVGIHDQFGEVGTQDWLQQHFKLTAEEIAAQVSKLVQAKK